MNNERIVNIVGTLIGALVFFLIFIRPEIGNYGKVSKEISYPLMSYASIGQGFEKIVHQRWPDGIEAAPVDRDKGTRVLPVYDESSSFPTILYIEKNDVIDEIYFFSDALRRSEAKDLIGAVSKRLSEEYTNGKGLRRYKKRNNYLYNKKQGVILHICREKDGSEHHVEVIISRYTLWRHIQSLVSSSI